MSERSESAQSDAEHVAPAVGPDADNEADFVATKQLPTRPIRAVALRYSQQETLPTIIATGSGSLAERIVQIANSHGIPVQENRELVELLNGCMPGEAISPESFRLVAELVSFLYHVDRGTTNGA